ncbi:MAG: class I SAM-dependent methyltransferase [Aliivibrio sp.]|nr:class I SAM-dependent methyltransferase [Aliivibrio sp.]
MKNTTLAAAQQAKMARLCQKLALTANDHVLEIGTGWGAMAIFMAKEYGCKVTTTTISPAQYAFTKTQIERHQLTEQITLLQQDYRQLTGQFDKVVSIEMIEAVGEAYLTGFIKICQARLKPKGLLALQCITIADPRYHTYSQRLDFIQTHIFPGGFLPSISVLVAKSQQHTQFVLKDVKDIGLDYARTLQDWRQRFESHLSVYPSMGLDPYFIRMWRFYFCYCEAGFLTENVSAVQLLFSRQD